MVLEIRAGEVLAVVGRTGAGKSTLLSLLPRLVDPPLGTLLIDGKDVRRVALRELRAAIAMVPQESFLFSASLADNIAFGKPDAGREAIVEAARLAGLEDDLDQFPAGLDTVVGERGITLSGGQKQRVALARALLLNRPILLLDDCLSAVDTQTEERILGHLRRVFVGRTVILVSHRVSTVRQADRVVVLDRGRIVYRSRCAVRADSQYTARPPEMSYVAPVENEQSSLASQQTIAAISSTLPKRPSGIFDSMKSMCCCEI